MSSRQVHPYPKNGQPANFQVKTYSTDTFVFRLHYKVTMGLLLACCLLITAIQLVTDPITCDVKVSLDFLNSLQIYQTRVCQGESLTPFVGPTPRSLFHITLLDLTCSSQALVPLKKVKSPRRRRSTTASTSGWGLVSYPTNISIDHLYLLGGDGPLRAGAHLLRASLLLENLGRKESGTSRFGDNFPCCIGRHKEEAHGCYCRILLLQ